MEVEEIKKEESMNKIRKVGVEKKKRGRKRIKEKARIEDQKKFFVDYSSDEKGHGVLVELINKANEKDFGREVVFKDLVDIGLKKLNEKDIEKIQDLTLAKMDKVEMSLAKYNKRTGENLSMGEYLVKQLKI